MARIAFATALWLFAVAYAVLRGGKAERYAAVIWLLGWTASMLSVAAKYQKGMDFHVSTAILDSVTMVPILWLALRFRRRWTLWYAAAQLVMLLGHVAFAVMPDISHTAWRMMVVGPSYVQSFVLIFGTAAYDARLRRLGA